MPIFAYIGSFIITFSLTIYFKPKIFEILLAKGLIAKNYREKDILLGAGLIFPIPCIVAVFPFWMIVEKLDVVIYIVLVLSLSFAGYLDDSIGDNGIKGLKGHFKSLNQGCLTTGILKIFYALIGGLTASIVYYSRVFEIIFHTILFCLCVNFINLLDLRPGRAVKGFFFLVSCTIMIIGSNAIWILIPLIGCLTAYIKDEMEEKCMLGDTGSNLIGGILGLYLLQSPSFKIKYIFLVIFLGLHIVAEVWSLSRIIDDTRIFKFIDRLGRLEGGIFESNVREKKSES